MRVMLWDTCPSSVTHAASTFWSVGLFPVTSTFRLWGSATSYTIKGDFVPLGLRFPSVCRVETSPQV